MAYVIAPPAMEDWNTATPEKPGYYWVRRASNGWIGMVRLMRTDGRLPMWHCLEPGDQSHWMLMNYSHWIGPLPEPPYIHRRK